MDKANPVVPMIEPDPSLWDAIAYRRVKGIDPGRVALGVALLNDRVPDWRARINRRLLNSGSETHDILGQLYGSYDAGLEALGLQDLHQRRALGFDRGRGETWEELDAEWLAALSEP
jgi:hypothetical protein